MWANQDMGNLLRLYTHENHIGRQSELINTYKSELGCSDDLFKGSDTQLDESTVGELLICEV